MWIAILVLSVAVIICIICEKKSLKKKEELEYRIYKAEQQIFEDKKELKNNLEETDKKTVLQNALIENLDLRINKLLEEHKENIEKTKSLFEKFQSEISNLKQELFTFSEYNDSLNKKITELEKKVDFYINIEEDSMYLNGDDDEQEEELDLSDIVLDDEQSAAFEYMNNTSENIFITGRAGTGKSYLLKKFQQDASKNMVVLAPTGIAALNVNGATIHSVFGYDNLVNLNVNDIQESTIKLSPEKQMILKKISTIIIDEISMVRADTFDKIDRILKIINKTSLPFGGKQMIVFGDLFQLPPIAKTDEEKYLKDRYGGIYFFLSDAYKDGDFVFVELTKNHRQWSDKPFFDLLSRVREGKITDSDIERLNNQVVLDQSIYDRYTALFPRKSEVEKINRDRIKEIDGLEYEYIAKIIKDTRKQTDPSLINLPITQKLILKKGALVMMVRNDIGKRWVNGTLGIVKELCEEYIIVAIDGYSHKITAETFEEQKIVYKNGKLDVETVLEVEQFPMVPAYAMTIHKAQGKTYKNIICDVDRCFSSGQAYVALSRCKCIEDLHLVNPISKSSIKVDKSILDFYANMRN